MAFGVFMIALFFGVYDLRFGWVLLFVLFPFRVLGLFSVLAVYCDIGLSVVVCLVWSVWFACVAFGLFVLLSSLRFACLCLVF